MSKSMRTRRHPAAVVGLVAVLLTQSLVLVSAGAHGTAAAAVPAAAPPGGLVASTDGFGWTEGSFAVTDDGAATYDLPLWSPAARGNVHPGLALAYHSRAGNGLLGVGWSLTGPSRITPCQRTLAQDGEIRQVSYGLTDEYCMDGSRLMPVGDTTGAEREYRTENDTFARIVASGSEGEVPDTFRVWTKDGRILTFGAQGTSVNGQLRAHRLRPPTPTDPTLEPSGTHVIAAWLLNRVEDRNGNRADYTYEALEGGAADLWYAEARPDSITYSPGRVVEFDYAPRQDPVDSFVAGVHTRTTEVLSAIRMLDGSELLREYQMDYLSNSTTGRSRLTSVLECDGNGACKRPLEFDWSLGSNSFDVIDTDINDVGTSDNNGRLVIPGDVDGNGRDDLIYPIANNTWQIRRGTPGGDFTERISAGIPGVNPETNRPGVRPIDIDRDGRLDLMVQTPQSDTEPLFLYDLYTSNGLTYDEYVQEVDDEDEDGATFGLSTPYFLDFDGNGTADFATPRSVHPTPSARPWHFRLNSGFDGPNRFGLFRHSDVTQGVGTTFGLVDAVDTDGDGRASLLRMEQLPGGDYRFQTVSHVNPLTSDLSTQDINLEAGTAGIFDRQFGDVNGDGLSDAIYPYLGLKVQLNSGNGFGPLLDGPGADEYATPIVPPSPEFTPGVRIVDFNNDGTDDVLVFHPDQPSGPGDHERGIQLYIWRDNGFERRSIDEPAGSPSFWGYAPVQPLDSNGDGLLDLVLPRPGVPDQLRVLRREWRDGVADLLLGISVGGVGGRVQVDYTTLGDRAWHTPESCTYPQVCLTRGVNTVARHFLATGLAPPQAMRSFAHTYRGARADLRGRGWLGFAEHTVTDEQTGGVTTTTFDNTTRDTDGPTELYPGAFMPATTTSTLLDQAGGTTYRRTTVHNNVLRRLPVPGTYTVQVRNITETEEERPPGGDWELLRSTAIQQDFDRYGNMDYVLRRIDGGRVYQEERLFTNDETNWLIGQLDRRDTEGCTADGECTNRRTTFDYDEAGNFTTVVVEPEKPEFTLTTVVEPGEFGVIDATRIEDANGEVRRTSFEYDERRLTLTAVVNPLDHRTTMDIHPGLGVPLRVVDPNGVPVTMRHDWFGRLRGISGEDGSATTVTHSFSEGSHTIGTAVAGGGATETVLDQLGRVSLDRERAFHGGWSTVRTTYDRLGRVATVSRPHLDGEAEHNVTLAYDNHNRLVSRVDPDTVEVTHSYSGLRTDTVDALGIRSFVVANVDGDVESRFEDDPESTGWLETSFEYGGFGEVTRMTAPDDTFQVLDYDLLGRRTGHTDPSAGTTTTTYTPFGEVHTETNGAGETSTYDYDLLGRIETISSPDGTATNTWDTAVNGVGNLATAVSADGVRTDHQYDPVGRPSVTTWTVDGVPYEFRNGYDDVGRPATLTYPAIPGAPEFPRLTIEYAYNASGYLHQISDAAAAGAPLWTVDSRDAAGQLTGERLDNGVVTTREFEPETGLLDHVTATGPGTVGTVASVGYGYDDNRNVTQRSDDNGRLELFTYDELDRLERWHTLVSGPGQIAINAEYDYDAVGNLEAESFQRQGEARRDITYGYGEDGAPPHAQTSRNGDAYGYDDAGRQVSAQQRTVEYNTLDLPAAITWGQGEPVRTEFAYDHTGARVLKRGSEGDQTVVSVAGMFERRTPAGTGSSEIHNLHNIVADGRVILQINRAQDATGGPVTVTRLYYVHADGQGSTVGVTNRAGRPVGGEGTFLDEMFYDPFGRRIDDTYEPLGRQNRGGPRQGYTSHLHDDDLGLINMVGRIYDPESRRFLTPDPVLQNPLSGQSHNRYAYVQNNPVTLVDPTGFQSDDDIDEIPTVVKGIDGSEPSSESSDTTEPETDTEPTATSSGDGNNTTPVTSGPPAGNFIKRNWLLDGPGWFNDAVSVIAEGGRGPRAQARLATLGPDQSVYRDLMEKGWGCTGCHLAKEIWGVHGPAAFNPVNNLPYDWAINRRGLDNWVQTSSQARFFVEGMTAIASARMGMLNASGGRPYAGGVPSPAVSPPGAVPSGKIHPRSHQNVPLPNQGERAMDYGTRVHQEFPRLIGEAHPGATGTFNVRPGLTGPDLADPLGLNAAFAEMKSLWDRQSRILRQARAWGFEPQTGRYFFYDRHTGFVFEGVFKPEWPAR